eukprot:gene5493-6837_t
MPQGEPSSPGDGGIRAHGGLSPGRSCDRRGPRMTPFGKRLRELREKQGISLTDLATATDEFTLGYVVGGTATTGAKPLVIRAAGPSLGALGVGGTISDPKLETFAGSTKTGENDNWGSTAASVPTLTSAFTAVGAFPFASPTSRDAAVATSLTTRDNSVKISAASSATGLVIAEIYDASSDAAFIATTPRLLNVSVLKSLGTGLTVGFTVAGSSA